MAEALGLTGLLDRRAAELSGGERRRLHTPSRWPTARRWCCSTSPPPAPTSAPARSCSIWCARWPPQGSAVVYSTHYLTEIEQLAASVVILDRGQVVIRGTVRELVAAHGISVVELDFRGPVPALDAPPGASIEIDGPLVRLRAHDPGPATADLLAQLGERIATLRSFEIVQPSLETVFLELTGRRYGPTGEELARCRLGGSSRSCATRCSWSRATRCPVMILLVFPLILMAFLKPTFRLALVAAGYPHANGAEQVVPGQAVANGFYIVGHDQLRLLRRVRLGHLGSAPLQPGHLGRDHRRQGRAPPHPVGGPVRRRVRDRQRRCSTCGSAARCSRWSRWWWRSESASCCSGVMITALCRTLQQANALAFGGLVLFGAIGGALVPINVLPRWARAVAPATPTYWAMRGFSQRDPRRPRARRRAAAHRRAAGHGRRVPGRVGGPIPPSDHKVGYA